MLYEPMYPFSSVNVVNFEMEVERIGLRIASRI